MHPLDLHDHAWYHDTLLHSLKCLTQTMKCKIIIKSPALTQMLDKHTIWISPLATCGASGFINSNAYQWCRQLRVHEPVDFA
jgi:hypothetical protein